MSREISKTSKISDIIALLQKLQKEHGDINVAISEKNVEYWGTTYNYATQDNVVVEQHAQPQGPKSGLSEKAVVFNPY